MRTWRIATSAQFKRDKGILDISVSHKDPFVLNYDHSKYHCITLQIYHTAGTVIRYSARSHYSGYGPTSFCVELHVPFICRAFDKGTSTTIIWYLWFDSAGNRTRASHTRSCIHHTCMVVIKFKYDLYYIVSAFYLLVGGFLHVNAYQQSGCIILLIG